MDKIVLTDKTQFPTEEIIFFHLGKSKVLWESVFNFIHTNYPDFSEQWNFYNDGKSWLMKITKKSKTIFWLSVIPGSFKITFYFSDKAETAIMESGISSELKAEFKEGKRFGKIRGLTLLMNYKNNIEYVKELISIKLKIK
jgi:hypothetical protein